MAYLIDSDRVIDHLGGELGAQRLLESFIENGIAVSVITYMEVYQGIARSSNPEVGYAQLASFLDGVPVIPITVTVARRCAHLREQLRRAGKRVNPRALDLLIAATALEYDLTLVTRNVVDYRDIPSLKIHPVS